jgi:endo-1,4-beta-D-glucanase Y
MTNRRDNRSLERVQQKVAKVTKGFLAFKLQAAGRLHPGSSLSQASHSRFSVAFVSSVQKSLPLLLFRQRANGMIHCQSEVSEMSYKVINFSEKFGLIDEQWQPKVIAEMNDYQFTRRPDQPTEGPAPI